MSEIKEALTHFIEYSDLLKGDEKGEAQVFCDRLFQAFGHKGYKEAGALKVYPIVKTKMSLIQRHLRRLRRLRSSSFQRA
jgi:hypothetical protein